MAPRTSLERLPSNMRQLSTGKSNTAIKLASAVALVWFNSVTNVFVIKEYELFYNGDPVIAGAIEIF